ncbi:anaerobic glycerol-3-phosphate dehydrogenase subunit B [Oscillochloris trichoides DG-6]|uniref:Anaerobic glycerol-3-phosphate dehydrogenase subunit B n=1 Tax=Oscillochloris trichoides DG-6 TaxID=765420 RepID=E1IG64_9CHLR|nr:glycerol-3-phosphate dehydrogenase subunit GlpB [Oscillochloris trichoides]EFO79798.1 anaerobic glycerol-3-phosphate dehydrogenase subunit B [Oscillochloris trichoides DG-6]
MQYDSIVIGAGISGMLAAIGRAEAGEQVLVLAKGHAATHWATGCIDLLDVGDGDPLAGVAALIAAQADHPYAIAGYAAIEPSLNRLREICDQGGYPLVGSPQRNLLLPTAAGALRPTCLVPVTMVAGDARQLPRTGSGEAPLLVVGFRELRDFFPPMIAANLQIQGFNAEGIYLTLPPLEGAADFTSTGFARLFEQPAFRAEVGTHLRRLVRDGGHQRIAMPAILGIQHAAQVVAELQAIAGAQIFEIPTPPPSVAGMRIYHILEQRLRTAGGRIQLGAYVQRGEAHGTRLEAVYSEAAAREQRHRANRFVLATGGIGGGGMRAIDANHLIETALRLPLRAPASRADWFFPDFLAQPGHPIFRSGVAVDTQLRPLDAKNQVVYTNVAVVGAAIAGCDHIREGAYEGVAVATGWVAGAR